MITFDNLKKLLVIGLLLLFAYNIGGVFIAYKFEQYTIRKEIKKQIKEGVPENELTTIVASNSNKKDINWQNEKEFLYRGNLYDVVRKEILANGDISYECINDKQETELFVSLDKQVGKTLDARHQGNNPAKTFFSALYFSDFATIKLFRPNFYSFKKYFFYELNYSIPSLEINSPPPQCS